MPFNRNRRKGFLVSVSCVLAMALIGSKSLAQTVFVDYSPRLNQESLQQAIQHKIEQLELKYKKGSKKLSENDFLISVGSQAFSKNIKKSGQVKLHLAFYISQHDYLRITQQHPNIKNTRAIYSGQSLLRQWHLAQALIPNITRFSTLTTTDNSANEIELIKQQQLFTYRVDKHFASEFAKALRENPLLVLQENREINTGDNIRRLLLSSYRLDTPVIGPNNSVVKAGALATVYSNREQILQALANTLAQVNKQQLPKNCHPVDFEISVNEQVANSFTVTIPDHKTLKEAVNSAGGAYCE